MTGGVKGYSFDETTKQHSPFVCLCVCVCVWCACARALFLCRPSSYVVNMGLIDKLYGCFLSVQGPVDESPKMSAFLQQASAVLHGFCRLCFAVTAR